MSKKRIALGVVLLAALAVLVLVGVPAFRQYQADRQEEAEMATFRSNWQLDPNDPRLLEVRLLYVDGDSVTLGFPTLVDKGPAKVVDFVPKHATFLNLGARQIYMASNMNATLSDIPLGSTIKVRLGLDGDNPDSYYIYDILVIE